MPVSSLILRHWRNYLQTKSQGEYVNVSSTKRAFRVKKKVLFIIFKGLSLN